MSGSSVFDDTSLKLARLFCRIITVIHLIVNQYEIANIYSHYQRISRIDGNEHIKASSFASHIHFSQINFIQQLYQIYPDATAGWNEFFQIVLLSTCTSIATIFYLFIFSFQSTQYNKISYEDIETCLKCLNTSFTCLTYAKTDFKKCDKYLYDIYIIISNNDGFLTFHQFMIFVSKDVKPWIPILQFRFSLIEIIITEKQVLTILQRKLKINEIRTYKIEHNDKLPPLPCLVKIKLFISREPHPDLYHFDPEKVKFTIEKVVLEMMNTCRQGIISIHRIPYNVEMSLKITAKSDKIEQFIVDNYHGNNNKHRASRFSSMSLASTSEAVNKSILRNSTTRLKSNPNLNGMMNKSGVLPSPSHRNVNVIRVKSNLSEDDY